MCFRYKSCFRYKFFSPNKNLKKCLAFFWNKKTFKSILVLQWYPLTCDNFLFFFYKWFNCIKSIHILKHEKINRTAFLVPLGWGEKRICRLRCSVFLLTPSLIFEMTRLWMPFCRLHLFNLHLFHLGIFGRRWILISVSIAACGMLDKLRLRFISFE